MPLTELPVCAIVAIGNDRTDEDMFRALPPSAMSIVVGTARSCAAYRVDGVSDVRRLLRQLIAERSARPTVSAEGFGLRNHIAPVVL